MNKSISEDVFMVLLQNALIEKYNVEVQDMIAEAEPHEFSDSFNKKIRRLEHTSILNEKKSANLYMLKKIVVSAAAIMGIIFGGLLVQPEVYAAVSNVIHNIFDVYDEYNFSGDNISIEDFDINKRLDYLPDGYYLSHADYSPISVMLTYKSLYDNAKIVFEYGLAEGASVNIDNERHTFKEYCYEGTVYYFYEATAQDDVNIILWTNAGYYYIISSQLELNSIIEIAENVN